jgi:hypothetical protein
MRSFSCMCIQYRSSVEGASAIRHLDLFISDEVFKLILKVFM